MNATLGQGRRRGAGQHVLVVAGEPDVAELLSTTLELAGYRISLSGTGAEALARVARHRFDLVVLDTTLPDVANPGRECRPAVPHRPPARPPPHRVRPPAPATCTGSCPNSAWGSGTTSPS
ncbi:response regulator, partial [Streptomyces sp. ISL-14]|nr:response regulator [Streptomyces sp. ISL-14]